MLTGELTNISSNQFVEQLAGHVPEKALHPSASGAVELHIGSHCRQEIKKAHTGVPGKPAQGARRLPFSCDCKKREHVAHYGLGGGVRGG